MLYPDRTLSDQPGAWKVLAWVAGLHPTQGPVTTPPYGVPARHPNQHLESNEWELMFIDVSAPLFSRGRWGE